MAVIRNVLERYFKGIRPRSNNLEIIIFSRTSHPINSRTRKKKVASTAAALSIVRQLFHLNVIEAFTGVTTVKKSDTDFEAIKGSLTEEVSAELEKAVTTMELNRADFSGLGLQIYLYRR